MTILVTGAAGFLGSHVVDLVVRRGETPRALIRPGDDGRALAAREIDIRRGDVADPATLRASLAGVDRVVHCAARTGPWGPVHEYERTNVHAVALLVRAAMAAGVRRVVHVSSITVHGNEAGPHADESAPLREEANPYSRSKVAAERVLARLVRELDAPITIVRPGWIYGPGDLASFARLARMVETQRMFLLGSGENHVPLIDVRDVAHGVLLACDGPAGTAPAAAGGAAAGGAAARGAGPYLLVNDEPVTQRQFLTVLAGELDVPAPTRQVPYKLALTVGALSENLGALVHRRQPPPVMRYGLQLLGGENRFVIGRARRELGFNPAIGVEQGVRDSVRWYRETIGTRTALEAAA
jgi:2-alkyl-3-oxoalkanoate reductase